MREIVKTHRELWSEDRSYRVRPVLGARAKELARKQKTTVSV